MSFCIAIDFEAAGGITPRHGFTQLGAALVDLQKGTVLAEFNEYANMTGYTWEERCLREFWHRPDMKEKHSHTVRMCSESSKGPYEVVDSFLDWAVAVCEQHGIGAGDVYLVSDNAAFDLGILRCFSRNKDIMYLFGNNAYRETVDVSSFYQGLAGKVDFDASAKRLALDALNANVGEEKLSLPKLEVSEDHDAVNDAKTIGLYWSFFVKNLSNFYHSVS